MQLWIKNIGASNDRLDKRWFEIASDDEFRTHVRFSDANKPTGIGSGDLLLFNAFVDGQEQGHLCAVARVAGDAPSFDPRQRADQWPWRLPITPLLVVPLAGQAPTLKDIGIGVPPMGSHKAIDPKPFALAVRLMARNALRGELDQLLPMP